MKTDGILVFRIRQDQISQKQKGDEHDRIHKGVFRYFHELHDSLSSP